jgi:Right handed beta helix region/F5/8 type C domain/IPT/TIG domain
MTLGTLLRRRATVVVALCLPFVSLVAQAPGALAGPPPTGSAPARVLYVTPDGAGTSCNAERPCSIAGAQAQVRQLDQNMRANLVVQLADGTYRLSAPLTFTAADSGSNGFQVIWQAAPGAKPVLSGGERVTGWHLVDQAHGIWAAAAPAKLQTRQLYVDGTRAPVAQGTPPVALTQTADGFTAANDSYASWRNPSGLEFVFTGGNGSWTQSRCRVARIDGTTITMQQPCWDNITRRPVIAEPAQFPDLSTTATPNRIEDAYELLHPGQWYLDSRQHQLYYIPPAGQDPNRSDIEAPVLQTLVSGAGTLDNPVHDIVLRGLQFSYATWLAPSGPSGFAEIQANIRYTGDQSQQPQGGCNLTVPAGTCPFGANAMDPAAVTWSAAHNVTIEDDVFTHLGAAGLHFAFGSQHNLIQGNTVTDTSGSGIELGSTNDPHPSDVGADDREINLGNTIANNYIHHIGVEFAGADGILLMYSQHTTVTHNQIDDVPWDAIDSGANAGHPDNADNPDVTTNINANNVISDNLIFDYHTILNDGGAIYVEGHQGQTILNPDGSVNEEASFANGTFITGNVAWDEVNSGIQLYDDIGSQWVTWTNNVEFGGSQGNGGCEPNGHIRFTGNYYSDPIAFFPCPPAAVDLQYSDNTQMPLAPGPSDLPTATLSDAGLEPAYRALATAAGPAVITVTPRESAVSSPTTVLIAGSGFSADSQVSFGGRDATSVSVLSPGFIEATAPAGAATAEATVRSPRGSYSGPSGLPLAAVTADSMDDENFWHISFSPYNVVDDNLASFWSSAETPQPHWVQVQFSHPIAISKVVVQVRRFNGIMITSATVGTSVGSGALQTQGTITDNNSVDIPFTFPAPVTLDTVRVTVNAETFGGSPRIEGDIAEIRFYDKNGHLMGNP